MKIQFLNDEESLSWVKEVHGVPERAQSFEIHGNEDAPEKIVWFLQKNPSITDWGHVMQFQAPTYNRAY